MPQDIFPLWCSISGKGRRSSNEWANQQPVSSYIYCEDNGERDAIEKKLWKRSHSDFFKKWTGLKNVDLFEEDDGYSYHD